MPRDRLAGLPQVFVGVPRAQLRGLPDRQPGRDVPGQRIVRHGLVGDEIEHLPARGQTGYDIGSVPE